MALDGQKPQPARFGALFVRALRLCAVNGRILLLLAAAGCALQALLYYFFHRTQTIVIVADALVSPVLAAAVFAIAANDLSEEQLTSGAIVARVGERAWAVIALSSIPLLFSPDFFHVDPNGADAFALQTVALFMTLILIFAPVYATLEPHVGALALLPRSVARSAGLIFTGNFLRAAILVTLSLAGTFLVEGIIAGLQIAHVRDALFWGSAPLSALLNVPLSALAVTVYFDALLRDRRPRAG